MNIAGKHKIVLASLVLAAGSVFYWYSSGRCVSRGRSDARTDLENGVLRVETCGHMRGWDGEYAQLLLQRYGINLRSVASCVVSDEEAGHLEGYNALMIPEIKRRFGADVLERTRKEAVDRHSRWVAELKAREIPATEDMKNTEDSRQP